MGEIRERLWHTMSPREVARDLGTDPAKGLSQKEAARRLDEDGPNALAEGRGISPLAIFVGQFQDFMVLVLLAATAVSAFLGETGDAIAILAIVILNAILGFIQEYRAEKSLEALKEMSAPTAKVIRDGEMVVISANDVVQGDVLVIEAGDRIAADARLIESHNLAVEESPLTGESTPVKKDAAARFGRSASLCDRRNMVYMGTVVTRGRGRGIVTDTGMDTEIGRIAGMIDEAEERSTPLQRRLEALGKWLVALCLAVCALVAVAGVLRGMPPHLMFLTGVSLAVAAIPEGLPAIVTVALAVGVQRMSRRRTVVRKLDAVETLGCATVICSDKTGTLTQNEMTVTAIDLLGRRITVSGTGYAPFGEFEEKGKRIDPLKDEHLTLALTAAALCNDAKLAGPPKARGLAKLFGPARASGSNKPRMGGGLGRVRSKGSWRIVGDPTEGALLVAAAKAGIDLEELAAGQPRVDEVPFEAERKMMGVTCSTSRGRMVYVKGAPDVVVSMCSTAFKDGKVVPMTDAIRAQITRANAELAKGALRVLGLAYAEEARLAKYDPEAQLPYAGLTYLGLAGMIDPPRPEVKKAVTRARLAGIRTVMITGDHQVTAEAIARELGIMGKGSRVLTGKELDAMTPAQLARIVDEVSVFARVSPSHKHVIVQALKKRGHIVAMTGDGVNDAPAVKEADIGIAMGKTGTDVTREAAAMVLTDDNYATIVAAVEEGRSIYDNIRKFIRYLLACNIGEVATMFGAVAIGLPLPLTPLQVLWMNLVTDGLPAMALGVEPTDKDVMNRGPRDPQESIFARKLGLKIVSQGLFIAVCTLAAFAGGLVLSADLAKARTLAFTCLIMSQLMYVFHCRSEAKTISEIGLFTNPYLVGAVAVSALMQIAVVHVSRLARIFGTVALSGVEWMIVLVLSGWSVILMVAARWLWRLLVRRSACVRVKAGYARE